MKSDFKRGDGRSQKREKRRVKTGLLQQIREEKDNICGTLARLLWRAADVGLKPLCLPRVQKSSLVRGSP